jgi:hypothetical protein
MKFFAGIFLFLFSFRSFGQLAGVPGSYYVDINPDTAIHCYSAVVNSTGIFEPFRIEINGDSQDDFGILGISVGDSSSSFGYIIVQAVNSSSYILGDHLDSVYDNYYGVWEVESVAKSLAYGDSVSPAGAVWSYASGDLYFDGYLHDGTHRYIHDFPDSIDSYVGIKYVDGNTTYYGWIRINMTGSYPYKTCIVKDYSMYSGIVGIPSYSSESSVLLFPNPAGNYFYIKDRTSPIKEVEIFDVSGKHMVVPACEAGSNGIKVDISQLSEGIYMASFPSVNGPVRQKLVIKR